MQAQSGAQRERAYASRVGQATMRAQDRAQLGRVDASRVGQATTRALDDVHEKDAGSFPLVQFPIITSGGWH
jgi:hypothetical protein